VCIVDCGHFPHFEIVIAGAERARLVVLALLRIIRDRIGPRARDLAKFLDALQILRPAITLRQRPIGAAFQHRVHFGRVERGLAGAADPGGNVAKQRIGE
jgi:hypothetical protein